MSATQFSVLVIVATVVGGALLCYYLWPMFVMNNPDVSEKYPRSIQKIRMREQNIAGEIKNMLGLASHEWAVIPTHRRWGRGFHMKVEYNFLGVSESDLRNYRRGLYYVEFVVNLNEKQLDRQVGVSFEGEKNYKYFSIEDKRQVVSEIERHLFEIRRRVSAR